ncbi:hypothetical protein CSB45_08655 [candidate division KSB3 bacterium]|uniref:CRISPR type III-associated protein domain-containing protein n=1 Tax=candidate division KSB3 bacterium TaxID=2044937 RepID=A0A2G6E4J3_9BACT|nr:MAG: hypothetical protein CSB45_08655 [candidate division KSB3 bacterium]PIE29709.1 MAG: hypothetical protein CSA57_07780 [candidate division KSB3 bacterium]
MANTRDPLSGKIMIQGILQCQSPLHIGNGNSERSELDILLDSKQQVFIPATSLIGALQHAATHALPLTFQEDHQDELKRFWGYTEKQPDGQSKGHQSLLRCSDLHLSEGETATVVIRDGIKIDNTTGVVEKTGKYDYELVEPGACFSLNLEMRYRQSERAFVKQMAATLYAMLANGEVRLGAKTNNGLGEVVLLEERSSLYHFDFSDQGAILHWLSKQHWDEHIVEAKDLAEACERHEDRLCMDVTLRLKHSLIIRSYAADPKMPDAVHISSKAKPILTGSSLKGAIRVRAERILNTIGTSAEPVLKSLFGDVNKEEKTARKGRLHVQEVPLPGYQAELQTRIKIDRFTGGTIESALFDSMPLFNDREQEIHHLRVYIERCKTHECGLLLLILKDLWMGDLAIGGEKNVGRGVFEGLGAKIDWNAKTFRIDKGLNVSADHQEENPKAALQDYVNVLWEYVKEEHHD